MASPDLNSKTRKNGLDGVIGSEGPDLLHIHNIPPPPTGLRVAKLSLVACLVQLKQPFVPLFLVLGRYAKLLERPHEGLISLMYYR